MFRLLVFICCLQLWNCQRTTDKYIAFSSKKVNWYQAQQICNRSNMILATVNSYQQHLQLIRSIRKIDNLLGRKKFWLGARSSGFPNSWTWLGLGLPLGYKKWSKDEPQSDLIGQEGCMVLGLDESWLSANCLREYYFVCEKSFSSNMTSEPLYI